MTLFKKCLALFMIVSNVYFGYSQQTEPDRERKFSLCLSINALNMLNDTYRFDVEGRKTRSRISHILTAEFFNGHSYNTTLSNSGLQNLGDDVSGKGIGLYQKWFVFKEAREVNPYISYGLGIRKLAIDYEDKGYFTYSQNSLEYYRYGTVQDVFKIKGAVYSLHTGIQLITPNDLFVFDIYLGAAYKKNTTSSQYAGFRSYDKNQSDFAYNGWATQVGFKVGIKLY